MNQNISQKITARNLLLLFFICLFLYSAFHLLQIWQEYKESEALYQTAQDTYISQSSAEPTAESGSDSSPAVVDPNTEKPNIIVDFDHLQEINDDVVGWIWMRDSVIHYPLVQGDSNDTYLYKTYEGTHNSSGSIFLDYRNAPGFQDNNTVIYGHNMKNGSMFASLKKFRQQEYYQTHKNFYIITPMQTCKYEVVAAFVTDALSNVYSRSFSNDEEKQRWLDQIISSSGIITEVQATVADKFVTLSTCVSGNNQRERYVVVGRLDPADTALDNDQEESTENIINSLAGEFQATAE